MVDRKLDLAQLLVPSDTQFRINLAALHKKPELKLWKWVVEINQEYIPNFTRNEQVRYFTGLRIYFGLCLSIAKRQVLPNKLFAALQRVKSIILEVYLNEQVKRVALTHKTGIDDEPYDFWPEMVRDMAQFEFYKATATAGSLIECIKRMTELFAGIPSNTEYSCYTLFGFEIERVTFALSEQEESDAKQLYFRCMSAVRASIAIARYDRAAVVLALTILDLEKFASYRGLVESEYQRLTREHPEHLPLLKKEYSKAVFAKRQRIVFALWRLAAKPNVSVLDLP